MHYLCSISSPYACLPHPFHAWISRDRRAYQEDQEKWDQKENQLVDYSYCFFHCWLLLSLILGSHWQPWSYRTSWGSWTQRIAWTKRPSWTERLIGKADCSTVYTICCFLDVVCCLHDVVCCFLDVVCYFPNVVCHVRLFTVAIMLFTAPVMLFAVALMLLSCCVYMFVVML